MHELLTRTRWSDSLWHRARGIAGGVYTQTTDVEIEINGLLTYDRKVIKIAAEELAEVCKILFTDP